MVSSQGWRDIRRGRTPRRRLLKLAMLLVLLALLGGFVYLVVAPFRHPSTHLLFATAGGDSERAVPSPAFALEQYVQLAPLRAVLRPDDEGTTTIPLLTPAQVGPLGPELSTWLRRVDSGDTVLIYLTAHEISGAKGAVLRPSGAADGRQDIAIQPLLERISRLPGGTKLLLLDTSTTLLPDDGLLLPTTFAEQLAAAVGRTRDDSLWVLSSHSLFEPTQTSVALRRTVFGFFVARGLKGDADLDRDQVITLGELAAYVRAGVGDWVKRTSGGYASQTPQLLWGGGTPTAQDLSAAVLTVSNLPTADRELDVQQSVADVQQPREQGKWESVFRERAGNRLLPLTNPVRDKLTEARIPEMQSQLRSFDSTAASGNSAGSAGTAAAPAAGTTEAGQNEAQAAQSAAAATPTTPGSTPVAASPQPSTTAASPDAALAASPASGPAAGSSSAGLPVDPQADVQLLDQLAQAWLIHDQLLEARAGVPRPLDYAPDLWRVYQQQLLTVDQSIRAGLTFDSKPLTRVLRDHLLPMQNLLVATASSGSSGERLPDRFLARRPAVAATELIGSIAAAVATGALEQRISEPQRQALQRYQEIVRSGSSADFLQWREQAWQAEFAAIAELRGLDELAELAVADWPLAQQLLQVRSQAEQAAVAAASRAAARSKLMRADDLRQNAERIARDRFGDTWRDRAEQKLSQAEAVYSDVQRECDAVLRINRLTHDLLQSLPYWIALQRHAYDHPEHPFPTADELSEVLATLVIAQDAVEAPQQSVAALATMADGLQTLRARLNRSVSAEQITRLTTGSLNLADAWFIRLLLDTPLVPAPARMQLLATVGEVEAAHLQAQAFDSTQEQARLALRAAALPLDAGQQTYLAGARQQAANWMRWQSTLLALIDGPEASATPIVASSLRQQLLQQPELERPANEFFAAYSELRQALANDSQQWSVRLIDLLSQAADLSAPELRDQRIQQLHRLQRAVQVLGAGLGAPFEPQSLADRLVSAHRYDLWATLWERDRVAMRGASALDLSSLTTAARNYQSLAMREPLQPPLAPLGTPTIEIQMPQELVFAPIDVTLPTTVTVINRGGEAAPVWLVANSDRRYLELQSPSGLQLYDEATLQSELNRLAAEADDKWLRLLSEAELTSDDPPAEPTQADSELAPTGSESVPSLVQQQAEHVAKLRRAAIYPHQPELAQLPPTLTLQPGEAKQLPVVLQRNGRISRNTRWSLRAITANDHSRQDAVVLLPDRSAVQLLVDGGEATWSQGDRGLTLHPFPNRATPYRVLLRNTRGRELTATVSVFAPAQPLRIATPETVLPRAAAERWLSQIGTTTTLVAPVAMVLPADGTPVTLLPAPPRAEGQVPTEQTLTAAPAAQTTANATAADDQAGGADAVAARLGTAITSGLLVWVHDPTTDTVAIESISLSPQRPQRYADVRVGYDAAIGQLQIHVDALSSAAIPATGIPVRARVFDDATLPLELTLSGHIVADAPRLRLTADIPPDEARTVTVHIDIDAFPRAFIFRFRPTDSQPSVPQWLERNGVRLTSPLPNTAFAAPVEAIEVVAEVDAPVGAFLDPRDELLIGIDVNRDRVFRNESPLSFRSDRQVEVRMLADAASGQVNVLAAVQDYRIHVPGGALTDARVNLLGYLRTGDRDTWSEPVEVILDGSPPRLGSIRVQPSQRIAAKTPLEISVSADDNGLSGVASVQVGVAQPGTSQFAAEPPPVEAVLTPGGTWAASFPTEGLVPGTHRLLLTATDRVGNTGPPTPLSIDVLSEEEVLAEKNRPKAINGRALHGSTAAAGATVELFTADDEARLVATRTADAQGNFQFARVAPGAYRLVARALVRNTRRNGQLEITIPEGDRAFAAVRILLE